MARANQKKASNIHSTDLLRDGDLLLWTQQLLAAIDYLHTIVKVVHRDIKPAFVFFYIMSNPF